AVGEAQRIGLEARVGEEILAPDAVAEPPELALVQHAEEEHAVARRELVVRADVGMRAAEERGRIPRSEPVRRVRHEQAQRRIEQRRLDALALAFALAVVER